MTFHGSLYYYADRYRLEVAAVVEPVPGREPTARYMADVLDVIRKAAVVALFSEPQLDPRAARAIASEAGLPLYEIDPVGGVAGSGHLREGARAGHRRAGQGLAMTPCRVASVCGRAT